MSADEPLSHDTPTKPEYVTDEASILHDARDLLGEIAGLLSEILDRLPPRQTEGEE